MSGPGKFQHEALFYAGEPDFLGGTLPFVYAGLDAGDAVLVVVDAGKIDSMRAALSDDAHRVSFADMAEVGRNPAMIIPAWRDFLDEHGGHEGGVRGIGEPIWAERSPAELVECQRHEALLNVAFAGGTPWRLLCPYDTASLAPDVLRDVGHSHPLLTDIRGRQASTDYCGDGWPGADDELPEPPGPVPRLDFGPGPLDGVRRFVAERARSVLAADELSDLLLAVTEVASNSLVHGGGHGSLRVWRTDRGAVCEVRDEGWIQDPLAGRARPGVDRDRGRGLWMANRLCDLMQVRSSAAGTVIRLHARHRVPGARLSA